MQAIVKRCKLRGAICKKQYRVSSEERKRKEMQEKQFSVFS